MNIKKINKKILVSLLSAMFVLTCSCSFPNTSMKSVLGVYAEEKKENSQSVQSNSEKDKVEGFTEITKVQVNTGNALKFYFKNGKAKIKLTDYRVNGKKDGYLLLDIKKDYVKGYSNKYFSKDDNKDDAMRIKTNFNDGISDTIVKDDYCSYEAQDSDFIRFYLPYHNATGEMTVEFSIPDSVQKEIDKKIDEAKKSSDKVEKQEEKMRENRMEVKLFSEKVDDDDSLNKQSGELKFDGDKPTQGFVSLDTYSDLEEEKVYKGFIFDKLSSNRVLRIKPKTNAKKIRLYLGAGDNADGFSYDSDYGEFDIQYYNNGATYRKVNDGKVHDSDDFKDREYDRIGMRLDRGFNSVDIPWDTNDGIIEIRLNNANNFLLNLKVKALTDVDISSGGSSSTVVTPSVNNNIDAVGRRYSGSDRYNTAIELSKKAFSKSDVAIIASGENFADALSGGGLAAIKNAPLLLVNNSDNVVDNVNKELRRLGVKDVYILGGKNSISVNTEMKITNDKDNNEKRRNVTRLSGKDRYYTSYEIYKEVNRTSGSTEKPILVNGKNFADALSAGPLAGYTKRGILLTDGHNLISGTKINKNDSDNIVIGGLSSMDSSFKGKRISGANRYETSVNVAKNIHNAENVIIASGEKYPDGLASITLYGKYEAPLLLTNEKSLPSSARKYIINEKIENAYIVGGINSVSEKVKNQFK